MNRYEVEYRLYDLGTDIFRKQDTKIFESLTSTSLIILLEGWEKVARATGWRVQVIGIKQL